MIFVGEKPKPSNLSEDAVKLLTQNRGNFILLKDKDGNVRVLKLES